MPATATAMRAALSGPALAFRSGGSAGLVLATCGSLELTLKATSFSTRLALLSNAFAFHLALQLCQPLLDQFLLSRFRHLCLVGTEGIVVIS